MIALLLALAPVTYGHTVYGTITPPSHMVDGYWHPPIVEPFFGNSQHCEHADCHDELERARANETHLRIECPHTLTTCKDDGEPVFRVDPPAAWREHCTATERIRETGEPLECETDTADDLYSLCRHNGGTPPQCAAEDAWVNDETSYCIWRSDGTVEAKNATCSDHRGERQ